MTHLRNVGRPLAVLALFGLLAVAHTWPLADVPTRRLPAHPDVLSGMWSLTALSRQMIENPAHLMDGNIFHPFSNTVAIVDHQFANALMAAPLVAAGVDAVQIVNLVILASFWLGGVFTYLLVRRLTGSVAAGLVAGCAYAFSSYHALQWPRVHLLATHWLPLAVLALHCYLDRPNWWRWSLLAASSLLLALSSWHLAIIGGIGMGIVAVWTLAGAGGPVRRQAIGLALVALLCVASLLPLAQVYWRLGEDWPPRTGEGRETVETLVEASANVVGLVARPPNTRAVYAPWLSRSEVSQPGIFPGVVVMILALPAVLSLRRPAAARPSTLMVVLRWWIWVGSALVAAITLGAAVGAPGEPLVAALRPLAPYVVLGLGLGAAGLVLARRIGRTAPDAALTSTYLVLAVAGAMLALGPRVFVGTTDVGSGLWRFDLLPIGLILRAPARLSLLFMLGTSVLAGIGVARWLIRRSWITRVVGSAVMLLALNADLAFKVGPLVDVPGPSGADRWLTDTAEPGAVIDYPLWQVNRWAIPASRHTSRRFVNGGGYLRPPNYALIETLPDFSPEQFALLWEHFHPRLVVVRTDLYLGDWRHDALDAIAGATEALRPLARFGPDRIFELVDRGRGEELYRRWPLEALRDKRELVFDGWVTPGRQDTTARFAVSLNGRVLFEAAGADAERPASYLVGFDTDDLVAGINTFELVAGYDYAPTAEGHVIGTTGVALAADVTITSDHSRATVLINGRLIRPTRGYLLVELDAATGRVTRVGTFDVSWYAAESEALAAFVRDIPTGSPVLVATEFDAARELTADAVAALADLGVGVDLRGRFQTMHAAIGVKGAAAGSALEITGRTSARIELGQPETREIQLASLEVR